MRRIFRRGGGTTVRDGTRVYPFLNPADSTNDLPLELFSGTSVALGELRPRQTSKIHMHPLVTMLVWVVSGRLSLRLKDKQSSRPYTLRPRAAQAGTSSHGCAGVRQRSRRWRQCAQRAYRRCAPFF